MNVKEDDILGMIGWQDGFHDGLELFVSSKEITDNSMEVTFTDPDDDTKHKTFLVIVNETEEA